MISGKSRSRGPVASLQALTEYERVGVECVVERNSNDVTDVSRIPSTRPRDRHFCTAECGSVDVWDHEGASWAVDAGLLTS